MIYKLVTIRLNKADDKVKWHLEAELRDGWEIKSVTAVPPACDQTRGILAVVLAQSVREY